MELTNSKGDRYEISSAHGAIEITPDDDVEFIPPVRGIYVGTSGDLKVDMADGQTVTFTGVVAGFIHDISVKRVYANGTNAGNIIGLY